ncbi:extracellular solute-binding protein [Streptomyces armeniacus]|uniref:Extracellular solute-binding protein n=1 Tax=Streptomyces armeniacus TaxID=83291 RepID=A0A345XVK1_9ACTN|nr:extracellular solute-binding protein [Streptomyces armeniacus]AXK35667.1 extracellular solute-binding protein [Streptomyces armeniacus]
MQRRRFLGLAATGMAGAAGLTASACSGGTGSGDGVTLKLVAADYGDPGGDNGSQAYWDGLARSFEKQHPDIAVDVSVLSWNEVDKKVAAMVADGTPPDIAQIGSYADYAARGRLYSVGELLPIPVQADYLPSLAEAGEVNRMQYGLPFVSSTRLLFYNKALFARAGLDPEEPPGSWAELRKAARALKAADVRIPYGLPLGPEEAPAETMMWLLSGGGGYTDNGDSYVLDSPENIATFEWLRDSLVGAGLTGDAAPADTNRQDLFDAFGRGEVGMLNGHPTLMQQADRKHVEYGTAVLPGKNGPASSTMGVADWAMAFKQNGHGEAAGKFLAYAFDVDRHYDFVSRYDLLPVTTSASARMRSDGSQKKLRKFLDQLPRAEFYPVGKVSWGKVSAEIKRKIGRAVAENGEPANVLGALQQTAEAEESAGGGR